MLVLITYDVSTETRDGQKRLRRMAKVCANHGQRVQKSVFECLLDPSQWVALRQKLVNEMNPKEDSLRFYFLGANWKPRVEHVGAHQSYDPEGTILI